jgi:hypothetical protein
MAKPTLKIRHDLIIEVQHPERLNQEKLMIIEGFNQKDIGFRQRHFDNLIDYIEKRKEETN